MEVKWASFMDFWFGEGRVGDWRLICCLTIIVCYSVADVSEIFLAGNVGVLAPLLWCKVDQLPSTYLEMKLGASFESGDGILGGTEDVDRAAVLFGCKVRKLPTTYLGLPFGTPHKSCRVWDIIEERFKEEIGCLEKTILVQRRKTHPY